MVKTSSLSRRSFPDMPWQRWPTSTVTALVSWMNGMRSTPSAVASMTFSVLARVMRPAAPAVT